MIVYSLRETITVWMSFSAETGLKLGLFNLKIDIIDINVLYFVIFLRYGETVVHLVYIIQPVCIHFCFDYRLICIFLDFQIVFKIFKETNETGSWAEWIISPPLFSHPATSMNFTCKGFWLLLQVKISFQLNIDHDVCAFCLLPCHTVVDGPLPARLCLISFISLWLADSCPKWFIQQLL